MQWLPSVLQTLQVISSILVIVLVLLQQGKGADMGAAFGAGSAGSVFGAAGAANFLSRATKWAAIVFFVTTGGLAWVAHHPSGSPLEGGVMQGFTSSPKESTPAGPAVPAVGPGTSGDAADASVPSVPSAQQPAAGGGQGGSEPAAAAGAGVADPSVPSVPAN